MVNTNGGLLCAALAIVAAGCNQTRRQDVAATPSQAAPTAPAAANGTAALRVLHASPDAPPVSVLLDGAVALSSVPYKTGSAFFSVPSGSHALEVRATGTATDVIDATVRLEAGQAYTAIAVAPVASISALLLTDDVAPPTTGSVKLRVVHAAPSAGPVDVYLTAPGADLGSANPTLASAQFKDASGFLEVPAGSCQVRLTAPGAKSPCFDSGTVSLVAGSNLTVVAVCAAGIFPVELVVLTGDASNPSFEIKDTRALVRAVHASADAPAVDVLVDGSPVLKGVTFGQASGYLAVDSGTRRIQVDPVGATMAVIDVAPTVSAGLAYTVLALNRVASIEPLLLQDCDVAPPAGQLAVRIIHAAALAGPVDIYVTAPNASLAGLTPVVADLVFKGCTGYLQLPAGVYRVRVTIAGTQTVAIDTGTLTLSTGQICTAVALDPAPGQTSFTALLFADHAP